MAKVGNMRGATEINVVREPLAARKLTVFDVDIAIDATRPAGKLRPLHGINNYAPLQEFAMNYPVPVLDMMNALHIPYCYFHDSALENPGLDLIDVSRIFPIFSADPDDPANYRFAANDEYLKRVADAGCRIIYRLGESIEKTATKFRTTPPADFEKWADICVHIIRHYNEGWADGFHWNIRDWTIWEEPNGFNGLWNGTFEEYLRLYEVTSKKLRAEFPEIRIGGPETTTLGTVYFEQFLDFVRRKELPLDFVCYSGYYRMPSEFLSETFERRAMLDRRGFEKIPLCMNEWHASPVWAHFGDYVGYMREVERVGGADGAVFAAAILCGIQDTPLQMACFYSACIGGGYGMFDTARRPAPVYYLFKKFCGMYDRSIRRVSLDLTKNSDDVQALASQEADGSISLMAGCYTDDAGIVRIHVPEEYAVREVALLSELSPKFGPAGEEEYHIENGVLTLKKTGCPVACFLRLGRERKDGRRETDRRNGI